jgi:hypothetical protein
LAAELFQQNEWQRSIPLSRTPSIKSKQLSIFRVSASSKTKASRTHRVTGRSLSSPPQKVCRQDVLRSGHYLAIGDIRGEVGFAFQHEESSEPE